jgi:hypothetical protein
VFYITLSNWGETRSICREIRSVWAVAPRQDHTSFSTPQVPLRALTCAAAIRLLTCAAAIRLKPPRGLGAHGANDPARNAFQSTVRCRARNFAAIERRVSAGGFSAHSGPSRATRVGTLSAQLMRQGRDWLCQPNGLAGIYETSAIQGRLQAGLSVDYGLTGFLVAWLSGQHFLRAVPIAILIGGLIAAGDADRKCPIGGFVTTLTVANPFDPPPRHLPALRNSLMSAGVRLRFAPILEV